MSYGKTIVPSTWRESSSATPRQLWSRDSASPACALVRWSVTPLVWTLA